MTWISWLILAVGAVVVFGGAALLTAADIRCFPDCPFCGPTPTHNDPARPDETTTQTGSFGAV